MPATALEGFLEKIELYYDFARDGGAVGAIAFRGPQVRRGFRITHAYLETITGFTGSSSTIAIHAEGANDILSAVVLTNFAAAGVDAGIQDGTAANSLKVTADRTVYLTVAVGALTAGKMKLVLCGYHTTN